MLFLDSKYYIRFGKNNFFFRLSSICPSSFLIFKNVSASLKINLVEVHIKNIPEVILLKK